MTRRFACIPVLLAVVLLGVIGATPAQAQAETYVDLSIEVEASNKWTFTARNDGTEDAYGVTVDIEFTDQTILTPRFEESGTVCSGNIPGTTCVSVVWNVGLLAVGGEREFQITTVLASGLPCCTGASDSWTVPARAVIKNTVPGEEERLRHDNTDTGWISVNRAGRNTAVARGGYWLKASVDDLLPDAGETVTFAFGVNSLAPTIRDTLADARVLLKLDNGLGTPTATTLNAGEGHTFSQIPGLERTWEWNAGSGFDATWPLEVSTTLDNPLPTGVARSDLCLTAELTARPDNTPVAGRSTSAEICFREDPAVLLQEGEAALFSIFPCVDFTVYPCSSDDTVELAVIGGGADRTVIGGSAARAAGIARDEAVLRPERVFVQVKDPEGRRIDTYSASVNSGTAPSWHTARRDHAAIGSAVRGVDVRYTRLAFTTDQIDNYNSLDRTVAVAGLDGAPAPGLVKVRYPTSGNAEFTPNPSHERADSPFSVSTTKFVRFVEFSALGTYKLDYTAAVTHTSGTPSDTTDDVVYSGTGSYIFHVGPVAELEVRDGGASSHATPGQRAFAIEAINNGPDPTEGAEVTVTLPEGVGVTSAIPSAGSYDQASGVWTLGVWTQREIKEGVPQTLTLVTDAAMEVEATAEVANTKPYTVCIGSNGDNLDHDSEAVCTAAGGSWHEGTVFDYLDSNSTARIKARPGTRGMLPDTRPGLVQALTVGEGVNLVSWTEPSPEATDEHGAPLYYDIDYNDDDGWTPLRRPHNIFRGYRYYIDTKAPADGQRNYRVRARYATRVGDWTEQSVAGAQAASGDPGVTIRPTALTLREGGRGSYSVRLEARPAGNVVIHLSNSNPDVRLTANRLEFTPSDWSRAQTVYVTAAEDADAADDTDAITHVIDQEATSSDYDYFVLPDVTVTVDDRDTAVRFTVGRSGATQIGVDEGGSTTYELALGTRPQEDVRVSLSYPGGQITVDPRSLTFTPENYNQPRTVTVTGVEDEDAVDDQAFITHHFSDGYADDAWLNVVVTDDDRAGVAGEVELALSRGYCPGTWPEDLGGEKIEVTGYSETDGGCFYSLRLNALPTGNVTVRVQASNSSKVGLDTTVSQPVERMTPGRLTFTPENWRDPQEIRFGPLRDDDAADNNGFTISHRVSGGGYNGVTIPDIVVNVADEDRIGFQVEGPPGGPLALEGDRSTSDGDLWQAVFYLYQKTQPTGTVTVAMSSDNPDVTLSPSRLSFTRSNWDQGYYEGSPGKRVLVRAAQDADAEDETATISFTVTSSDADYAGMKIPALTVRVQDDDRPESAGQASQGDAARGEPTVPSEGVSEAVGGESGEAPPAVSFVIYHDPGAGAEAVDRYNQAVTLLTDARILFSEVIGDVQKVERLAGVPKSVMPRFFLGDPAASDWVSAPGENNGGLRWLKEKVAELSGD